MATERDVDKSSFKRKVILGKKIRQKRHVGFSVKYLELSRKYLQNDY